MMNPPSPPPPPPPPPPRQRRRQFQFSILTLLIVMTVVAALSPLLPYVGQQFAAAILLSLVLVVAPVGMGSLALYCRGRRQTFFLGASAASVGVLFAYGSAVGRAQLAAVVVIAVLQLVTCVASGYLAVGVRRFVERSGWDQRDGDDS